MGWGRGLPCMVYACNLVELSLQTSSPFNSLTNSLKSQPVSSFPHVVESACSEGCGYMGLGRIRVNGLDKPRRAANVETRADREHWWYNAEGCAMSSLFQRIPIRTSGSVGFQIKSRPNGDANRRVLADLTSTIQVSIPSNCPVLDVETLQQPSGTRDSCVSSCSTSGPTSYNVERNSTLTINLVGSPSSVIITGGSANDQLMSTTVPDLTITDAAADPSAAILIPRTLTQLVFHPLRSWYPSFTLDRTTGRSTATLAIYALNAQLGAADLATTPVTGLPARACRFNIQLTVIPSSLTATNVSQLATSAAPSTRVGWMTHLAGLLALLPIAAIL
eukprot:jgi/Botrbrau1/9297/Bobra.0111s0022.1